MCTQKKAVTLMQNNMNVFLGEQAINHWDGESIRGHVID